MGLKAMGRLYTILYSFTPYPQDELSTALTPNRFHDIKGTTIAQTPGSMLTKKCPQYPT